MSLCELAVAPPLERDAALPRGSSSAVKRPGAVSCDEMTNSTVVNQCESSTITVS